MQISPQLKKYTYAKKKEEKGVMKMRVAVENFPASPCRLSGSFRELPRFLRRCTVSPVFRQQHLMELEAWTPGPMC